MGPPIFIGGNKNAQGGSIPARCASMGPPIFIGGNFTGLSFLTHTLTGFNGAADFHRRKLYTLLEPSDPAVSLQWGRRFSSAEIRRLTPRGRQLNTASMGPPIFIGGNHSRRHGQGEPRWASMGPPIFIGGTGGVGGG